MIWYDTIFIAAQGPNCVIQTQTKNHENTIYKQQKYKQMNTAEKANNHTEGGTTQEPPRGQARRN